MKTPLKNISRLARKEGKTASSKMRELVGVYFEENDFARIITDTWSRISKRLKEKGITRTDSERVNGFITSLLSHVGKPRQTALSTARLPLEQPASSQEIDISLEPLHEGIHQVDGNPAPVGGG